MGYIPNLCHYCKKFSFLYLWNPSCIHKRVPVYACFGPHTQANAHVRRPRANLVILFPKIYFCSFKRLCFHFNTPQVNLISDWALNWPWALEFEHHWGMRARVVKGTKCGVYRCPFWFVIFTNRIKRIREKTLFSAYGSGPTHTHNTHHTYMGCGATLESYVGFVCLKSNLCCSRSKKRQVHCPKTCFATYKQITSDSLSQSHLNRKTKTNRGAL